MWAGQFYSRGAYTFFRHNKRKVTALRLHSRAYSRNFTHTMTKTIFFYSVCVKCDFTHFANFKNRFYGPCIENYYFKLVNYCKKSLFFNIFFKTRNIHHLSFFRALWSITLTFFTFSLPKTKFKQNSCPAGSTLS